jgi:hypothetical protein
MADGRIPEKYSIPTHRPAHLGSNISLHQERLLAAFRAVLAGKKISPLIDDNGKTIKATITFEDNGTATLKVGDAVFAFTYAGLLSPEPKQRLEYLEGYLKDRTLAVVYADELRSAVGRDGLSDEEFLSIIETLLTAQESFVQTVKAKVAARDLTNSDLLPDDPRYWDNLIAPLSGSQTLDLFLNTECEPERSRLLRGDPVRAFNAIALSFCAPALVPIQTFSNVSAENVLQMLEQAASFPDHFVAVGAFEICADRICRDIQFEAIGIGLLDHLLGDMDQLSNRCKFYAGIFAMTIARLAEHETLRRKPPFWRRLTAAAHSSLVLRSCDSDNADDFFKWAMEHSGKPFLFSVLLEGNLEPRWKPDWLTAKHLVADAFGRVDAAVNKIPEQLRPPAWLERIEKAREWIVANHVDLYCILPAIGESARRKLISDEETHGFRSHYEKLYAEPNGDNLLMCGPGFYSVGITKDAIQACHAVLGQLQKGGSRWDEDNTQYVLQTLSFVAMQAQDVSLADAVADFCVEKTRELPDEGFALEILCRLIECASANSNRVQAMEALARRLESVASLAHASSLLDLHDTLRHLQALDETLSYSLGRTVAMARLGRKAA